MIKKYLLFIRTMYVLTFLLDLIFLFLGIYENLYLFIGLGVATLFQAIIGGLMLWDATKNYDAEATTVMMAAGFIPFGQPFGIYFAYRFKRGN